MIVPLRLSARSRILPPVAYCEVCLACGAVAASEPWFAGQSSEENHQLTQRYKPYHSPTLDKAEHQISYPTSVTDPCIYICHERFSIDAALVITETQSGYEDASPVRLIIRNTIKY